jgi:hypothetical protein
MIKSEVSSLVKYSIRKLSGVLVGSEEMYWNKDKNRVGIKIIRVRYDG